LLPSKKEIKEFQENDMKVEESELKVMTIK
jgi:hypothetical protein